MPADAPRPKSASRAPVRSRRVRIPHEFRRNRTICRNGTLAVGARRSGDDRHDHRDHSQAWRRRHASSQLENIDCGMDAHRIHRTRDAHVSHALGWGGRSNADDAVPQESRHHRRTSPFCEMPMSVMQANRFLLLQGKCRYPCRVKARGEPAHVPWAGFCLTIHSLSRYNGYIAPIAQRIEYRSSEPRMGVRFPLGAHKHTDNDV